MTPTTPETDFLARERKLIGNEKTEKLKKSRILIFGAGGVGSYIIEAIVRAGVEHIGIADFDTVSLSNINRQLIADFTTVGMKKTDAAKARCEKINPDCVVTTYDTFVTPENAGEIIANFSPDYIADAIDNVSAKIALITCAKANGIRVISSMGTGNKLHPEKFKIADISKTSVCPLARVMRRELKARGITGVPALYSEEEPVLTDRIPASISFVPSCAGLMIAGYIIRELIEAP